MQATTATTTSTTTAHVTKTAKKSRNGCQECKSKRLKCDELKPGCLQCKRRRKQCPGYERKLRWSTKYEKSLAEDNALSRDAADALESFVNSNPSTKSKDVAVANVPATVKADGVFEQLDNLDVVDVGSPGKRKLSNVLRMSALNDEALIIDDHFDAMDAADPFAFGIWNHDELDDFQTIDPLNLGDDIIGPDDPGMDDGVEELPRQTSTALAWTNAPNQYKHGPVLAMSKQMVDSSTFLVEYWFSDVCQMFSAFDSDLNPNRQLARSTWSSSEPVYHALSYMAATCLADTLPQIKSSVPSLATQAMDAIRRRTAAVRSGDHSSVFPTDLLFAMFAVGTSLAWTDTKQLGTWLLNDARSVLAEYEARDEDLDLRTRQQLSHFQQGLVYWDMLLKAVSENSPPHAKLLTGGSDSESSSPVEFPATPPSAPPHPWTGTSAQAHATFGTVMELCRRSRARANAPQNLGARALREALHDIEMATRLARSLRRAHDPFSVPNATSGAGSELTNDARTPLQHLVDAEEAYRLASLLQLHLAFPDDLSLEENPSDLDRNLDSDNTNHHNDDNARTAQTQTVSLALQLVHTLERIPLTSGTRCILPLAIISAAAGLEFIDPAPPQPPSNLLHATSLSDPLLAPLHVSDRTWMLADDPTFAEAAGGGSDLDSLSLFGQADLGARLTTHALNDDHCFSHHPHQQQHQQQPRQDHQHHNQANRAADITTLHVRVAHARRQVLTRLNALHGSLPRRPIAIALKLVKAIWAEYDACGGESGGGPVVPKPHWMDVMSRTGLWTLFG